MLVPAVFAVSVATNLTGGRDTEVSLGFGVANTAEAVVAGLILTAGLTRAAAAGVAGGRPAAARDRRRGRDGRSA